MEGATFEASCLALLGRALANQSELAARVADLTGQNASLSHQVGDLYGAVRIQCQQLLQSDQLLQRELQSFQTGGPQRAMAAVFHKLFRDLVRQMTALDDLVALLNEEESAWSASLRVARDRFEALLVDWGCKPIEVRVGTEEFDPEVHEAAGPEPGEVPEDAPENLVVKVRRRGWSLGGQVLQFPLVVVS